MHKYLIGICLLIATKSMAQKKYFQQHVDYKIEVKLDDQSHILRGFEKIDYTNNSTDTLRYLIFHLYPNAYKNDKTAFAAQEVENGQTKFYYSKDYERGFIDSLSFQINDEPINVSNFNNEQDVVLLELSKPLLPSATITITTPFRVVIPEVFSRLGHDEQSYQISQWYPKPAVYDKAGWHPQPYLDQGEFYSEFGNFDVTISLPSNYVVASTAELTTASEKEFIQQRIETLDSSKDIKQIESSKEYKTIQYKQKDVHDFAWFADKRFQIERTILSLKSGEKIACISYFKPENYAKYKNSSKVIYHTVDYLSNHVGKYPYSHASIVDGVLLAGGGMEYPMVTVIGRVNNSRELQTIIVHEVGHNWFQGILANNERDNPWMDEGINSFYESIIDDYIDAFDSTKKLNKIQKAAKSFNGNFIYLLSASENTDQPISAHSTEFTSLNYGGIVYKKTQLMLNYLQGYLGEETFEKCMKAYFNAWNLKHPTPEDFSLIIRKESGINLDWFFNNGLNSTQKIDYKIKQVHRSNQKKTATVISKTAFKGPIPLQLMQKDSILKTDWIDYPYDKSIIYDAKDYNKATHIAIDAFHKIPEMNIINNQFKFNSLFPRLNLKFKPFTSIGQLKNNQLFAMPTAGYNHYNGIMIGAAFHNITIPNQRFQFIINPMYSTRANTILGNGVIGYSIFPSEIAQKITFSIGGRTFHHNKSNLNISKPLFSRHIKTAPSIKVDFKRKFARATAQSHLIFRYINLAEQNFGYERSLTDSLFRPFLKNYTSQHFGHVLFTRKNSRTLNPFSYDIEAIGNNQFIKLGATANARVDYHLKNKALYVRAFAGKFINFNTNRDAITFRNQYLNSTYMAQNDIMYDDVYIARNEQNQGLHQQISIREGGFKIKTNQLANPIGISDNWLTAINLRSDFPIKLPVKIQAFLDFGTFANAKSLNPSQQKALYDAGLELHLFKDIIQIYAPLLMSKDFKDYTKQIYPKNRFLNTMSFSINLNRLNILKTAEVVTELATQ